MTDLANYVKRELPGRVELVGDTVRIEPMDWAAHGRDLETALCGPEQADLWRFMPFSPIADLTELRASIDVASAKLDWIPMAIVRNSDAKALGMASYMRLRPEYGSCEVGCIAFGSELQKTRAATEAMYLMAAEVFETLGYRRYEWKCDNGNEPSKRAAERYGFVYEGLFRQDLIVKGLNRDTAWFSITDAEWPALKAGFEIWLADENFDKDGMQRVSLAACRE